MPTPRPTTRSPRMRTIHPQRNRCLYGCMRGLCTQSNWSIDPLPHQLISCEKREHFGIAFFLQVECRKKRSNGRREEGKDRREKVVHFQRVKREKGSRPSHFRKKKTQASRKFEEEEAHREDRNKTNNRGQKEEKRRRAVTIP